MAPTTPKKSPDAPHKNLRMTPQRQQRRSLGALPNGAGAPQRGRPKTSVDNRDKENSAHADTGLAGRSVQDAHNTSASIAGSSAGSETVIPDGWLAARGMPARAPATASFSISLSSTSFDSVEGADPPSVVLSGGAFDDANLSAVSQLEISQISYSSYDADASEADGFAAVDAFAQTGASLKGGVTVKKEISDNCDEEQVGLVAITAKPEYEHLSFEELRLKDYVAKSTSASIGGITDEVDDADDALTDTSETISLQGIDCQRGTGLEPSDGSGDTNHSSVGSSEDGSIDTNSTTTVGLLLKQLARSDAEKRTLFMENAQLKDQCSDLTKSLSDSNARTLDLEQQLADQQNGAIGNYYCALYHKVDDELHEETLKSEKLSKDVETLSDKVTDLQSDNNATSMLLVAAQDELEAQQTGFDEKEGTLKEKVSSSAKENGLLMDEVASLTKDNDTLQKRLNDAKESASATKLELESANSALAKEKAAIEEQLEAAVLEKEALSNQVSTQAEEKTQLEEQCSTLKKSEATLQKENSTLTVEKEALSKQVSALTEEQFQLEEQCASLKESEATLKKAKASLTAETGELNVRVNALAGKNATLQVQAEVISEERDELLEKCEEQKTTIAQLLDQDDSLSYQHDSDESEWEFVAYERDQLAQKLDEAKTKISELKENLSSCGAVVAQRMQEEKDVLTDRIQSLTDRIQSLTDENEKLAREAEKKIILAREVQSLKQEVEVRKAQWQQHCILGED